MTVKEVKTVRCFETSFEENLLLGFTQLAAKIFPEARLKLKTHLVIRAT
jgi:hypothetical protein